MATSSFFQNYIKNKIFKEYFNDGTCSIVSMTGKNGAAYTTIVCKSKKI